MLKWCTNPPEISVRYEVGTLWAIRGLMLWLRIWGRGTTRYLVAGIAFYYLLFSANARRSSQAYLRRLGLHAGHWSTFQHLWSFATTVMDRFYFAQDRFEPFEIERHGHEHLVSLIEGGRGGILLGAHLGSFDVMRTQSVATQIPVNMVGDFENAERISSVLRQINPKFDTRLISMRAGQANAALHVRDAIGRGELVAILGDRSNELSDTVEVDFLGGRIALPIGPYVLASVLDCPIHFVVALHTAPNRYALYCEPFAESIDLPRARRKEGVAEYAQRYADRLAYYCRLAPYNWFNFFDFWPELPAPEALGAGTNPEQQDGSKAPLSR
jgi:predicted LPLAT superfamily acyltransferase